jgi:hypothetical protein
MEFWKRLGSADEQGTQGALGSFEDRLIDGLLSEGACVFDEYKP